MNLFWSKERQKLKEAAIAFATKKLNGSLLERDREGAFFRSGWHSCADFGLQGMFLPKRYGGMALRPLDIAAILEGIGYGTKDNGLLFSLNAQLWGCQWPICHFGTESQKKKFLPGLCQGRLIGAHAMTESESGSDVYGLKTIAIRNGKFYTLNGHKTFVTNAPIADLFIVFARVRSASKFSGISCFLVEKDTPGLSVGKPSEKMGLRTSPMADVSFCNCVVPKNNLIGKDGSGALVFQSIIEQERIFILAGSLGAMERLLEGCIAFARQRIIAGKSLAKYQSLAHKIVGMKTRLEMSRLLLYKAAWRKHCGYSAMVESAMAKLCVSETYIQFCRDLIQIYGASGYMAEFGIERELRDAMASTLYSGSSEVLKDILAGLSGL